MRGDDLVAALQADGTAAVLLHGVEDGFGDLLQSGSKSLATLGVG